MRTHLDLADAMVRFTDDLNTCVPSAEEEVLRAEQFQYLRAAVAELPERLRFLVCQHVLAGRPLREVGRRLGVSDSRASELRADALAALRDALNHAFDPDRVQRLRRTDSAAARRRAVYFEAVDARLGAKRRPRRARYVGSRLRAAG